MLKLFEWENSLIRYCEFKIALRGQVNMKPLLNSGKSLKRFVGGDLSESHYFS